MFEKVSFDDSPSTASYRTFSVRVRWQDIQHNFPSDADGNEIQRQIRLECAKRGIVLHFSDQLEIFRAIQDLLPENMWPDHISPGWEIDPPEQPSKKKVA